MYINLPDPYSLIPNPHDPRGVDYLERVSICDTNGRYPPLEQQTKVEKSETGDDVFEEFKDDGEESPDKTVYIVFNSSDRNEEMFVYDSKVEAEAKAYRLTAYGTTQYSWGGYKVVSATRGS